MKKYLLKYRTLGHIILLTVLTSVPIHNYPNSSTIAAKHFGNFILKVDHLLSRFFDDSDLTPYNDIVLSLQKTMITLTEQLAQGVRSLEDPFVQEMISIIEYGLQQFNAAVHVIELYNGKGNSSAQVNAFVADLKKVFDPDKAFSNLKTKLTYLQKRAAAAHEEELVQTIEQLIAIIDKKRSSWNNKRLPTLLAGLRCRMGR